MAKDGHSTRPRDRDRDRDRRDRDRDKDRSRSRDRYRSRRDERRSAPRSRSRSPPPPRRRRSRSRSPQRRRRDSRSPPRHKDKDRNSERNRDREKVKDRDQVDSEAAIQKSNPQKLPVNPTTRPAPSSSTITAKSITTNVYSKPTNGDSKHAPNGKAAPPKPAKPDKMDVDNPVEEEDAETILMRKMMGFGKFKSTKQTKVPGNNVYAVRKEKKTEYRQYMNRVGGFNRPLSPSR